MCSGSLLARSLRVVITCETAIRVYRVEDVMKKMLKEFIADESGATAIEYALIATGIALAIISAVNGVGTALKTKFIAISTSLK
jgi:pilus assembly protein Flp/PilA